MAREVGTRAEHETHLRRNGHAVSRIRYFENRYGSVMLEICEECHYMTAACEHEENSWNGDGTILTCDLCGVNGT